MAGDLRPLQRAPLLVLGFLGLLIGVGAGLARLGYRVPDVAASAAASHGPLMIGGFFGVVIALERAVAIGRYWAYLGPLLGGLSTVAAIAGAPLGEAWLLAAAGIVFLAASIDVWRRQRALFTLTLALGAACWPVGSLLWAAGLAVHDVVTWWLAFLILTIAGERLELSRFLPPSPTARRAFVAIVGVIFAGLLAFASPAGAPLFALGLLALSAWLLKQDIARRTVRKQGLTRFIAVCLLSGYGWLAVGAVTMLAGGFVPGSRSHDAALHALALGFVFSMVFGHAPIILPAVLRVTIRYHWSFYVPLALLHASLALRVAGDAADRFDWTRGGGMLNAVALAAFIVGTAAAVLRARQRGPLQDAPAATPGPGGPTRT